MIVLLLSTYIRQNLGDSRYIPQVLLNYKRQSTVGWNIWNVLLDFEGGILSVSQIVIDAMVCNDWSPIVGNPAKFGLGFSSMAFDVVFMIQHYVVYNDEQNIPTPDGFDESRAQLLEEED